jgi:feruloyl esterase
MTRVQAAVLAQCDALDGLADGKIADPRVCNFNPSSLTDLPDGTNPWTPQQRNALATVYSSVSVDGTPLPESMRIYPGFETGFSGWFPLRTNTPGSGAPIDSGAQAGFFRGILRNAIWPGDISDSVIGPLMWNTIQLNSTDPYITGIKQLSSAGKVDPTNFGKFLSPLFGNKKIIIMQGLQDPALPVSAAINNYQKMADTFGGIANLQKNVLLYTVPDWGHCSGNSVGMDPLGALIAWMKNDTARPGALVYTQNSDANTKQRILCPEPSKPILINPALPNVASSWQCNGTSNVIPQSSLIASAAPSYISVDQGALDLFYGVF